MQILFPHKALWTLDPEECKFKCHRRIKRGPMRNTSCTGRCVCPTPGIVFAPQGPPSHLLFYCPPLLRHRCHWWAVGRLFLHPIWSPILASFKIRIYFNQWYLIGFIWKMLWTISVRSYFAPHVMSLVVKTEHMPHCLSRKRRVGLICLTSSFKVGLLRPWISQATKCANVFFPHQELHQVRICVRISATWGSFLLRSLVYISLDVEKAVPPLCRPLLTSNGTRRRRR